MNIVNNTDEPRFAAFVAIDWGDSKHAWSLQPANGGGRERGQIEHSPEAVGAWVLALGARFGGQPIAVAMEQSRGALVFMLGKYEQLHIYPIHPRAASQFRGALFPSGAKDDPVDADLLLDLLMHHRDRLRRLNPDTAQTRLVQHLVEGRRKLVNEKTRQSNRLTAQLKLYFPQILAWFDKIDSPLVGEMLKRWPTLETLQKARPATLRSFFTQHNCRRQELIERRLVEIHQAVPAVLDEALIQSAVVMVKVLIALIAALREGIAGFDREIEKTVATHPDFAIFDSFPVLARRWLRVCWLLSARKGTATRPPRTCRLSPGLRPSPSGAASRNGFTFAGRARALFVRPSTNGLLIRSDSVTGLPLTIVSSGIAEKTTTPLSERWPSNGSESPFAAGKTVCPMTTLATSRVSVVAVHR